MENVGVCLQRGANGLTNLVGGKFEEVTAVMDKGTITTLSEYIDKIYK